MEAYPSGAGSLKGLATKAGVDLSLVRYWSSDQQQDLQSEEAEDECHGTASDTHTGLKLRASM